MHIEKSRIEEHNHKLAAGHKKRFERIASDITEVDGVLQKLIDFQIAIPSWALGTGGTRFGRFPGGGEPRSLEEKVEDIGLLHALNRSSGAISLHIPWDIPANPAALKATAGKLGIRFDAMNSNTFQDQKDQKLSYKYGSLQHVNQHVRQQAVEHNIQVIRHGKELGSKSLTVWLSDGSCFPGQLNFRKAFQNTLEGAYTLVDLGHHHPNTNIEQIVSLLLMEGKLGGFHFNDSKYGDDDLTVGSINPYQLFLIFNELIEGMDALGMNHANDLGWMIDASHNVKDPLEDLLQSVEAIMLAYAQALLVDEKALKAAQQQNDTVLSQEILQQAYRADVRPLVAEARFRAGAALQPLVLFRDLKVREKLIGERGARSVATGL